MDIQAIDDSIKAEYFDKEFKFGDSAIVVNHLAAVDYDLRKYKRKGINISVEELAEYISEKVLVSWSGLKTVDGLDIPYSKKAAFNALKKDLNFLKLVVETSSLRSNFKVA